MQNIDKQKKKRYLIYTRCSTDEQAQGDYTTLDAQAHHCKNMLDAFGYELAKFANKGIVNDDGYSGKDLNRPGIQSILADINKKRSFDGIIFFRLDRLTRNPRDLYALIDLFRDNDIDFVSVRENLDSSTAIGRVVIGILGLLSAFERELTGERVKASAIARVRQGLRVGGKTPIGYKLIKNGDPLPNGKQPTKIIIDKQIAPHIKIVFEMAADNKSLGEIGQELLRRGITTANGKIWRRQGISTIIKCPVYKGYLQYNREIYKGKHEPLVSEKLWEKSNAILVARLPGHSFQKNKQGYTYLLGSLIRCGQCGSHLVNAHSAGRSNNKFYYYECSRSRQGLGCTYKRISAPGFDQAIISYFKRASQNQDVIIKAIGNAILEAQLKFDIIETKLNEKQTKLDTLRHKADKLIEIALGGTIPQGDIYKAKLAGIEVDIGKIEDEISKLQIQKKIAQMNASSGQFLYSNIQIAMRYIDKAPPEAQKGLMQALIKNITVSNDKIAINMYIGEKEIPIPESTRNGDSMATATCVSPWRPIWGG